MDLSHAYKVYLYFFWSIVVTERVEDARKCKLYGFYFMLDYVLLCVVLEMTLDSDIPVLLYFGYACWGYVVIYLYDKRTMTFSNRE